MLNATITVVLGETARPDQLDALSRVAAERNIHLIVLLLCEIPPVPI